VGTEAEALGEAASGDFSGALGDGEAEGVVAGASAANAPATATKMSARARS